MADIKRYQLKCKNCSYYWDTKYAKIPARCPSCGGKIFGTYNYEALKEYKEGCFIATAAYDTPFTRDINILRLWRDSSLSKSSLGRNSVSTYYTVSPPIAEKVNKKAFLKKFKAMKKRYPMNCAICGDRMENLVWNPNRHQWRCVDCYEGAHKEFPEIYP